jgi:tetratricopeptide (TPR) repeat protein
MHTINWTERLSEYLDGTLTPAETAACEAWLSQSAEGRTLLEELRRVVAKAKTLPDVPVPASVWAGIAAGIQASGPKDVTVLPLQAPRRLVVPASRRWNFSPVQLAAAAALLMAVGTGIGVTLRPRGNPLGGAGTVTTGVNLTPVGHSLTPKADETYDRAVADLQVILQHNRASLDTATVRVLETSLARIDKAIADAQRALDADPQSAYLNDHLSRIKRKKLDLLRQGTSLARAS